MSNPDGIHTVKGRAELLLVSPADGLEKTSIPAGHDPGFITVVKRDWSRYIEKYLLSHEDPSASRNILSLPWLSTGSDVTGDVTGAATGADGEDIY
jgi:hypothetical protein